jgi:two-component system, OmpR family, KDP operon response regulator KdpE
MNTQIMVVEDDPKMQRLLKSQLEMRGYDVQLASTGREALLAIGETNPAIMLLDITLPEVDGLEVCRRVREWSQIPIILVTAADTPQSKVTALELGADDYLTKPFHMGELIARIRAVMRRYEGARPAATSIIAWDAITMDLTSREVKRDGETIHVTKIEYELLKELVTHPDRALTYDHLLNAVWGPGYEDVRPVHVHICNLRRKLEPSAGGPRRILAIPGIGYRFRGSDAEN